MRILFILPKLSGGGAEKTAAALARHLSAKHTVTMVCLQKAPGPVYSPGKHVRLVSIAPESRMWQTARSIWKQEDDEQLCIRLLRYLKKLHRIEVSISFMEMANYMNAASRTKEKVILSVRNNYSAKLADPVLYPASAAERLQFERNRICTSSAAADHIAALSDYVRLDQIRHFGTAPDRVSVIRNFCDTENIRSHLSDPVPASSEHWFSGHTVITAGRLIWQKGHWHLIRAFRKVVQNCPGARLVILGNGILRPELDALIRACRLEEHILLAGHQTDPVPWLARAEVFAFSSLYEGFGNILLEAMACGLPIVSVNCPGGPAELLAPEAYAALYDPLTETVPCGPAEYGILTPVCSGDLSLLRDPDRRDSPCEPEEEQLAGALLSLLQDPSLCGYYRKKSAERIRAFRPEKILPQWENLLRS